MNRIEDAPRDRTRILVLALHKSYAYPEGEKVWEILYWDGSDWFDGDWRSWSDDEVVGWFPLPEISD